MPSAPSVIVVHAHPDDESIFTGLLIRRIADRGGRVVLVMATGGEHGTPAGPSGPGEGARTLASVRLRELERACEVLGVARLELLGRRDSGGPGTTASRHPRALGRSRPEALAGQVARIAARENAAAVLHDDAAGIYGHPDHVAVHRVGRLAARMAGISGYEVTVDHERLGGTGHLVARAADWLGTESFGTPSGRIGLSVRGTRREMRAKRAAMAAHSSQIEAAELVRSEFDRWYGHEWLTRTHGPAVLESTIGTATIASPTIGAPVAAGLAAAALAPVIPLQNPVRSDRRYLHA